MKKSKHNKNGHTRYLFDEAPISLWEEDFSGVKKYIDSLRKKGVNNFEKYFDKHPEAVKQCSSKVKFLDINKATLKLLKAKNKNDLLKNISATFTEDAFNSFKKTLVKLIEGAHTHEIEGELQTLKGDIAIILIRWVLPPEYKDTWSKIIVSMSDITERQYMRNLLKIQRDISLGLSETTTLSELLTHVLDTSLKIEGIDSGGVYLLDPLTGVLNLIIHKGLPDEFVRTASHYKADTPQTKLVMKGDPIFIQYPKIGFKLNKIHKKEGIKAIAIVPIKYENKVIGALNLASHVYDEIPLATRNVIESIAGIIGGAIIRVKAEESLRESEEKFRTLIESSPIPIFIFDKDNIHYINPAFTNVFGYKYKDFLKISHWDLIHPDCYNEIKKRGIDRLSGKDVITRYETRLLSKKGETVWVDMSPKSLIYNGKQATIVFASNITERKKMEEQLIHSEKMSAVGQLAAGVAHEFNNLLTIIMGNAEMSQNAASIEDIKESLKVIETTSMRGESLVRNLSIFSRPKKLKMESGDIIKVIDEVAKLQKKQLKLENINLKKEYQPHSNILFDFGNMEQVFMNLFVNARHAILPKKKGEIIISIKDLDNYVEIQFSDNGIGMDNRVKIKIFEPFFTTKGAFAKDNLKIKGSGLGLSVTYKIIQQHKGIIEVESGKGRGTTFIIRLPISKKKGEISKPVKAKKIKAGKIKDTDLKILVVDDEKEITTLMKAIFKDAGYNKITVKASGEQALNVLKTFKPDVIFLDLLMPDMTGEQFLSKVRSMKMKASIIIMSGKTRIDKEKLIKKGAFAFLKKPFYVDQILNLLNEIDIRAS